MPLKKPPSVSASEYKSAKWDEVTRGRDFRESDVPTLELLCHWHQVAETCMTDMTVGKDGSIQVAYENDRGDINALPQVDVLKKASAEIRALNRQLGIVDGRDVDGTHQQQRKAEVTPLAVIQGRRKGRSDAARAG